MNTIKLIPSLKQTIWGGQKLKELYGGENMDNIAESWVLSCHKAGESVAENGEFAGKPLTQALAQSGENALGTHCNTDGFPILIKLIDAADRLSVQVHPDNEYARIHENEFGKTECWYIVDCEEGAELIFGMSDRLTREEFAAAIADNTLLEHVRHVPVHPGDVAFIPAGTLHAIGKGILLAEVQQSSDTTYRVYDYGRLQNGKPRELHVQKAVDVTNLTPSADSLAPQGEEETFPAYTRQLLCRCDYFSMEKLNLHGTFSGEKCEETFQSFVVLGGEGEYRDEDTAFSFRKGDSLFVPAGKGGFALTGNGELLRTTI